MPLFTLHRNFCLRTTKGHTISFEKGRAVHVPPICVPDAIGIGAVPVDKSVNVLGDEDEAEVILTPAERKAAVFDAFRQMKARDKREDFTASGVPNAKRLFPITGFEVTSKARDEYWMEFRTIEQDEKDQGILDSKIAERTESAVA